MAQPVGRAGRPAAVLTEREWMRALGGAAAGRPASPPPLPAALHPPGDLTAALAEREHFPPFELAFSYAGGARDAGDAASAAAGADAAAAAAAVEYDADGPCGYAAVDGDVEGSIELLSALRRARIEPPSAGAPPEGDEDDAADDAAASSFDDVSGGPCDRSYGGAWGGGIDADGDGDGRGSGLPSLDSSMAEQLPSLAAAGGDNGANAAGAADGAGRLSPIRPSSSRRHEVGGRGSAPGVGDNDDSADLASLAAAFAHLHHHGGSPTSRPLPDAAVAALATPPRPPSRGARSALLTSAASPAGGHIDDDNDVDDVFAGGAHGSPSAGGALPAWPSPRGSPSVCDRLAYIASGSPVVTPDKAMPPQRTRAAAARDCGHSSSSHAAGTPLGTCHTPQQGGDGGGDCTPPRPGTLPAAIGSGGSGGHDAATAAARRAAALCDDVWTLSPLLSPFSSLPQKLSARRPQPPQLPHFAGAAHADSDCGAPASKCRQRRPSVAAELTHATTAADGSARALWTASGGSGAGSDVENDAPTEQQLPPHGFDEDVAAIGGIARALETALEEVQ
jgi:hypothetical protein